MGHSQATKLATHERIVDIAARRFRETGLDGISVADIMKEAGLTVGGFYKHFASRDALVEEALAAALADIEPFEQAISQSPARAMRMYLSASHRDSVTRGCALSLTLNDVAHSTDGARDIYTDRVANIIGLLADAIARQGGHDDGNARRPEATLAFSACIGAIGLARAVSDPALSKQILENVLAQVLRVISPAAPETGLPAARADARKKGVKREENPLTPKVTYPLEGKNVETNLV